METIYSKKDELGRVEFLNSLTGRYKSMNWEKTEDTDVADLHITGITKNNVTKIFTVEVKKRYQYNSTDFSTALLEKKKYDSLRKTYPDRVILYAMLFKDKTIVFDLEMVEKLNLKLVTMYLPKNNNNLKNKITKEVYELPLTKGYKI